MCAAVRAAAQRTNSLVADLVGPIPKEKRQRTPQACDEVISTELADVMEGVRGSEGDIGNVNAGWQRDWRNARVAPGWRDRATKTDLGQSATQEVGK